METRIRSIGNSVGIILPRQIARILNFHAEEIVELDVDVKKKRLYVEQKKQSLRENLLKGILSSQEDNLAFANGFDEF